jgi:hypothetical protein
MVWGGGAMKSASAYFTKSSSENRIISHILIFQGRDAGSDTHLQTTALYDVPSETIDVCNSDLKHRKGVLLVSIPLTCQEMRVRHSLFWFFAYWYGLA